MNQFLKTKFNNAKGYAKKYTVAIKDIRLAKARKLQQEKLGRLAAGQDIVKLHIGCGPRVLKGWINIDRYYETYQEYLKYYTDQYYPPEVRGTKDDFCEIDVTKEGLHLPDSSVDLIFHEDFIEHILQRDQVAFLAETFRILKKGGIHRINTPNLLESMRRQSDFSKGFAGVFFQEWDKNHHVSVLTPDSLRELANMVGYSQVVFNGRNKSISPLIPKEYRPNLNNRPEDGNLFADLIK